MQNSNTDWARLDAMTDDEIDTSDISPLTAEFFARAVLRMPPEPQPTLMRLQPEDYSVSNPQRQNPE